MIKKICFEDTGPWWALVFGEIWSVFKKKKKGNSTFDLFKWDFEGVRAGSKNRATKALQTQEWGVGGGGGGYARQENFLI